MRFWILFLISPLCFAQNVAIIDTGLHEDYYSRFDPIIGYEVCVSESKDNITVKDFDGILGYGYKSMSVCKNGQLLQTGTRTSTLPRRVIAGEYRNKIIYEEIPGYGFYKGKHHDYVLEAARRVGANTGQIVNVIASAFHNPSFSGFYSDPHWFERTTISSRRMASALDYINSIRITRRISVVSMSFGYGVAASGCSTPFDDELRALSNNGVALVAATGNDYLKTKIAVPACSNYVWAVGATDVNGKIEPYSNTASSVPFLTWGSVPHIEGPPYLARSGTSYAAPRVATYLGRLKIRNPTRNMRDILFALRDAGKKIPDSRSGTSSRVFATDFNNADLLLKGSNPELPPPSDPQFPQVPMIDVIPYNYGEINTGSYGVGFGTNAHNQGYGVNILLTEVANTTISNSLAAKMSAQKLSENQLLAQASTTCGSMYKLTYQVYDIDYDGEIALYINKTYIGKVKKTGNNVLQSQKVEICGSKLKVGANLIEFRKATNNEPWGVKNILLEFTDRGAITLPVGTKNTNGYGYGFGSNRNRSQLVVNFTKPTNGKDLTFSVTGWDIDREDENRLYLNDEILGFLSDNCSSCFNGGDTFEIPSDKLRTGKNQLTFIQRSPDGNWSGFQDEKWGVKDLLLKEKGGSIVPILQLLLLDE